MPIEEFNIWVNSSNPQFWAKSGPIKSFSHPLMNFQVSWSKKWLKWLTLKKVVNTLKLRTVKRTLKSSKRKFTKKNFKIWFWDTKDKKEEYKSYIKKSFTKLLLFGRTKYQISTQRLKNLKKKWKLDTRAK